jgi:hypothetical protein
LRGAARDALDAIARSAAASPRTRLRAESVLVQLDGESKSPARLDGVTVAIAEDAEIARACVQARDLSRSPALRRRDVHLLASRGAQWEGELASILLDDPSAEVRSAAAAALSREVPGAAAREALRGSSENDPAITVRRQALQVLARIEQQPVMGALLCKTKEDSPQRDTGQR